MNKVPLLENPIKLTQKAISQIQKVIDEESLSKTFLRIGVLGGGCSGLQYFLDFVDESNSIYDITYNWGGINVIVDGFSAAHLIGTEIDFVDNIQEFGFKFNNPNITRQCGCGASFST